MKKIILITFCLLLIKCFTIAQDQIPLSKQMLIGEEIVLSGELFIYNGWQPNIRFITDNNEIIGIAKNESYELSNEDLQRLMENNGTYKLKVKLAYIGNVSLPYYEQPLMCFSIKEILSKDFSNCIYSININNRIIRIYRPNYTAKDLLIISSIRNDNNNTCYWGINKSILDNRQDFTEEQLINSININTCIENANWFINNAYGNLWTNQLKISSISIHTMNMNETSESRNDWYIVLTYRKDLNTENDNEKIFMFPSGEIILSSNNYENVRF